MDHRVAKNNGHEKIIKDGYQPTTSELDENNPHTRESDSSNESSESE